MNEKNILKGVAVAPGITIAEAYVFSKEKLEINNSKIDDVEDAKEALEEALEKSKKELKKIFSLAIDKLGDKRAAIFEAQIMILDDPVLIDTLYKRIEEEKRSPEHIVDDEITKYQEMMNASHDAYMKERSHDIEDIKNRIIKNIKKKRWRSRITEEVVVVSQYLTPADTVLFSRANVKAFVTNFGGLTSHAAIVARSLNIPAVVGIHDASNKIQNGDRIIVDGFKGLAILNPDNEQLKLYRKKMEKLEKLQEELHELRDLPAVTKDGKELHIMGNLDLSDEINILMENGPSGLGLVRTEQIFAQFDEFPDEEEQYKVYKELADKVAPGIVTIRAFDIGGDKVLPYGVKEPNPFLGWRGIRFLLDNLELFKTQIKAVLRASVNKNIWFMLPMVSSISEIRDTKEIIESCKEELKNSNLPFDDNLQLGIMVEVPSAAVMAMEFADEVDFLSIGTNDLIQYILAVDRGNDYVNDQYQEFNPAVIKTLNYIIEEGKKGNVSVSLCGEMAADTMATPLLVGLGLDSLSVSGSVIPYLKKLIRNLNYEDTKKLAEECLSFKTEKEIHDKIDKFVEENLIEQTEKYLEL